MQADGGKGDNGGKPGPQDRGPQSWLPTYPTVLRPRTALGRLPANRFLLRSRVARAPTPANKALGIGPLSWHPDNKSVLHA